MLILIIILLLQICPQNVGVILQSVESMPCVIPEREQSNVDVTGASI